MLTVLIGGLTIGFILAPLAMGIHISYRMLRFADISVDGTFALGGMLAARLLMLNVEPVTATIGAVLAGSIAGAGTGFLITRLHIQRILAGILMMTALYSVNLYVLGKAAHSFDTEITLYSYAQRSAIALFGSTEAHTFFGMKFFPVRVMSMLYYGATSAAICGLLLLFFSTRLGMAVRGAGSNEAALRALGGNVPTFLVLALAISNGMAALSGALLSQELGMASITDGVGMIVVGLACVMIGDAFFGRLSFAWKFTGAVLGALIYRLLIAILMFSGVFSGDVKLFTTVFVIIALVLPRSLQRLRAKRARTIQPE
ncbi:MAG: ABC transporter permease [Bacteroidota bacterium]